MNKQITQLRSKAHALKPIVIVGTNGVTENVLHEIERALYDHELIKIKIATQDKKLREKFTKTICDYCQATLIQALGHIITIYRKRPEA